MQDRLDRIQAISDTLIALMKNQQEHILKKQCRIMSQFVYNCDKKRVTVLRREGYYRCKSFTKDFTVRICTNQKYL